MLRGICPQVCELKFEFILEISGMDASCSQDARARADKPCRTWFCCIFTHILDRVFYLSFINLFFFFFSFMDVLHSWICLFCILVGVRGQCGVWINYPWQTLVMLLGKWCYLELDERVVIYAKLFYLFKANFLLLYLCNSILYKQELDHLI